ncbi:MAG: uridine kinase, partial [Cyclobacteriaceae bacterium]|nr:uridine kinase [Cyclobacteriaceae bacterium]MDX5467038.1 uridine kinase [Cyclobacteriaceae bacterium]
MKKPFIVGITGGSASGKTLFLERLLSTFEPGEVCLISQDNYYKPRHLQPIDAQGVHNFDTPYSIDFEQYASDIRKIQNGETVLREEYTFNNAAKKP